MGARIDSKRLTFGAWLVPVLLVCVAQDARAEDRIALARSHFKAGQTAFRAGDFESALAEFRAGYGFSPRPEFLFNIGNALYNLGRLREAREQYEAYVAAAPQSVRLDQVVKLIETLRRKEELAPPVAPPATQAPPTEPPHEIAPPAPQPIPPQPVPPQPMPPHTDAPAANARPSATVSKPPQPRRLWYRDRPGAALVASGFGVLALGTGLWASSAVDIHNANAATVMGDYLSLREGVEARQIAGIVSVALGGAVIAGGVIRYLVVGARR